MSRARTLRWLGSVYFVAHAALVEAESLLDKVGVVAQVVNDWTYHGTSEVLGEPVVGLNAELSLDSQWFFGIEGHLARLRSSSIRQRQQAVAAYVGREFNLGQNWHSSVFLTHRLFIDSVAEWDFTELSADLTHDSGFTLRVDYSPDYYARDTPAVAFEAHFNRAITDRSYLYLMVGALEIADDAFLDHQYGSVGIGASLAAANVDAGYQFNSRDTDEFFGSEPYSPSQWVVRLSYRLW